MEFMMFLHMNKNLIDFFTNIFPEMSEVDIFILKIVTDLKKKFPCKKKREKIWRQITGIALPLRLQNIGTHTMPRLW